MTFTCSHIDNGFYRISDKAAGALAKLKDRKLPRHGYEIRVEVSPCLSAWLQRTPLRYRTDSPARGWVWSIYRVEGMSYPVGGQFTITL